MRHSLAIDHAFRPLFAYLGAAVVPTAVFAASEDWGAGGSGDTFDGALAERFHQGGYGMQGRGVVAPRGGDAPARNLRARRVERDRLDLRAAQVDADAKGHAGP